MAAFHQPIDTKNNKKNKTPRFVSFLLHLNVNSDLERVATPFLNYFLEKQGIEEPFRQEIKNKWINNREEHEAHRVYCDPKIDVIRDVYHQCHQNISIPHNQTIKHIDETLNYFTYAALIYKFYRNPFVHGFRPSPYATFYHKMNNISIRYNTTLLPSGEWININDTKPQLDVGIGLFTESIRKGADIVYELILQKQWTNIPYDFTDEFVFEIQKVDTKKGK